KVFKKDKEGLKGRFKIVGQVGLGLIVGLILYYNDNVVVREFLGNGEFRDVNSLKTTVPFLKGNEIDYGILGSYLPDSLAWLPYVFICTFIITAVSNGS